MVAGGRSEIHLANLTRPEAFGKSPRKIAYERAAFVFFFFSSRLSFIAQTFKHSIVGGFVLPGRVEMGFLASFPLSPIPCRRPPRPIHTMARTHTRARARSPRRPSTSISITKAPPIYAAYPITTITTITTRPPAHAFTHSPPAFFRRRLGGGGMATP